MGDKGALTESLSRLATYYREAPGESRRFVKDEADFQTLTQQMSNRTAVVNALIAALDEI